MSDAVSVVFVALVDDGGAVDDDEDIEWYRMDSYWNGDTRFDDMHLLDRS